MKNKGFTLIEMLGIITVLALLLILTFPNLNKSLKQTKENNTKNYINNLKVSAEAYIELNRERYPELDNANGTVQIKVQDLYDANLMKGQYDGIDLNGNITIVKQIDGTLKFFYEGNEIGIETPESDDEVSREIAIIKKNVSQSTPDGIYYYNSEGNLGDNTNYIYLDRSWDRPNGNILIHNHQFISGCIQLNGTNYDYYKGQLIEQNHPCSTTRGENLVVNGDLSLGDNTNFSNFSYVGSGNNAYLSTTRESSTTITGYYMPVDIYNKSYDMGMTARSNKSESKHYIGFISYDIDKQVISSSHISYLQNTLTTLARNLNNGDEYVYMTDLTNWNKITNNSYQRGIIFWNYKDSTGYEYPELTYSRNISKNDLYSNENIDLENNRIKLNEPWNGGYVKAGTKLSQKSSGITYVYSLKAAKPLPTDWEIISTIESDVIDNGSADNYSRFWHGTRYIKIKWWTNYNEIQNTTTDYKNIYIREITE